MPGKAAGASLTGKDCNPYMIHYAYDTTALANGTATAILESGGKSWFFLTADYAFGTQLQQAAAPCQRMQTTGCSSFFSRMVKAFPSQPIQL